MLAQTLGPPWQSLSTEAAIVLYPFTRQTSPAHAVMLLLQHVAYHIQLGFVKVLQYTQVRRRYTA